ncbi:MAG: hypothetical protein ACRDNK_04275 [Solirubrobacteraceae bacterium]
MTEQTPQDQAPKTEEQARAEFNRLYPHRPQPDAPQDTPPQDTPTDAELAEFRAWKDAGTASQADEPELPTDPDHPYDHPHDDCYTHVLTLATGEVAGATSACSTEHWSPELGRNVPVVGVFAR